MAVEVIRTMQSVGSWICGSGCSSTRTSRRPCQVRAFMGTDRPRSPRGQTSVASSQTAVGEAARPGTNELPCVAAVAEGQLEDAERGRVDRLAARPAVGRADERLAARPDDELADAARRVGRPRG